MQNEKYSHIVRGRELKLRGETLAAMKLAGALGRPAPQKSAGPGAHAVLDRLPVDTGEPVRILCISDYEGLRISRELLLRQAGFYPESCLSATPLDVFAARRFPVALLCHSVPHERAVCIAGVLHRYHSRISVVRLNSCDPMGEPYFDRELECPASPEELLRVLREEARRNCGCFSQSR